MRKALFVSFLSVLMVTLISPRSHADVNVGLSLDQDGVKGFYLAIGQYYNVPEREVVVVRERQIPDDEIPVVFFVARKAHVEPEVVIALRLRGQSWMDICYRYRLSPEIFYVPIKGDPGPPYGKAYGHYKNTRKDQWRKIRLSDDDVVNLVNLNFFSNHYRCSPNEVIAMRSKGRGFVQINDEFRKGRGNSEKISADDDHGSSKKHGKGKKK